MNEFTQTERKKIFSTGDKLEQGHYTVLKELGVGGMGIVYQCRDEQLLRDVAIKMLLPEVMSDKSSVEIFRQEARFAAKLEQPNIVTVYDIGVEERQHKLHHFVSMEYLPGGNLGNRLVNGPLTVEHCLNWMKQLATGLNFAHKNGVVHQDIKADNIFITNEGDLKIGDFGLARLMVGRVHYNSSNTGMGTPAYMSPELCRGELQDHRSDIYSLGILFFEMCTGQLPFRARGMIEMATKHSSAPIPSATRINPQVPQPLDKVIRKMMAKTPDERFQITSEIIEILDDLIFDRRVARLGLVKQPRSTQTLPAQPLPTLASATTGSASSTKAAQLKKPESAPLKAISGRHPILGSGKSFIKDTPAWTFQTDGPIGWTSSPLANKEESVLYVASSDGVLYAIELETGKKIWTCPGNTPRLASPVLLNDSIITVNTLGLIESAAISSGKVQWTYDARAPIFSTPAGNGNRLYVATEDGRVLSIDNQNGAVKWIHRSGEAIVCAPSMHEDLILFGTRSGSFSALSAHDGKVIWKFNARSPIVASPAASVDTVYFGTQTGGFYALEAEAGGLIWEYQTDKPIMSRAVIAFTSVIFASFDKWIYCCEKYDGSLKWKASVRGRVMANLIVERDNLLVSTQEGFAQMFNTKSGSLLWQKDFGKGLESAPLITDKFFFQGTTDGDVIAHQRVSA